ncbi:hypothetical protein QF023_001483 [Chryseobacterium sp. SLBN-27]|uniref:hypothetical protein n=1 Tax=Chryseobacterium sp. SLBN-27 TaxID=3042287 RepID=UPI00285FF10F|nr:hypothetical protein [Chryseobacterium sp. SLBN-27]MDR6157967.1 hypothetical protein [Chryseobacterium sp. SLBN-27]
MKKIFSITIILLFLSIQLKAQLDTMNYLKQFEANKAHYIGQPFSKLLNDMTQIQPKTIWNRPPRNNKNIILQSSFNFCIKNQTFNNNVINLVITWQDYIPYSQTYYYSQKNSFYFTNDEKIFYGNKIIKDIWVYRY